MSQATQDETKTQEQSGAAGDELARPTARSASGQLKLLLKTMRPKQWTKNVFVWAALIFDVKLFDLARSAHPGDVHPLLPDFRRGLHHQRPGGHRKDRQHPRKRNRPLASGALSPRFAVIAAGIIVVGACRRAAVDGGRHKAPRSRRSSTAIWR